MVLASTYAAIDLPCWSDTDVSCQSWVLCRVGHDVLVLLHLDQWHLVVQCAALLLVQVDHVGRQLLSSLMGEWGLLQQLQGLMGVFLLASPAMVEWTERCFAAVEAAKPSTRTATANRHSSVFDTDGLYSPGSVEAAVASAGVVVASAGHWAVGVEDLDVVELELQLQVSSAPRYT